MSLDSMNECTSTSTDFGTVGWTVMLHVPFDGSRSLYSIFWNLTAAKVWHIRAETNKLKIWNMWSIFSYDGRRWASTLFNICLKLRLSNSYLCQFVVLIHPRQRTRCLNLTVSSLKCWAIFLPLIEKWDQRVQRKLIISLRSMSKPSQHARGKG